MIFPETHDYIKLAYGSDDVPDKLLSIFESLDGTIKDANSLNFGSREDVGVRSTQIVSLVVFLWKLGVINDDTPPNPTT